DPAGIAADAPARRIHEALTGGRAMDDNTNSDPPAKIESIFARDAKEKRQFPRFRADMKLEAFRTGAERALKGHVYDVSEGGVGGTIIGELPVGEQVIVEISGK